MTGIVGKTGPLLLAAVILINGCGSPLEPSYSRWSRVTVFPSSYIPTAITEGGYVGGYYDTHPSTAAILSFDKGIFGNIYLSRYYESFFTDIDNTYNEVVAAGFKTELPEGPPLPYFVICHLSPPFNEEVFIPASIRPYVTRVIATGPDNYWLLAYEDYLPGIKFGYLTKLSNRGFHNFGELGAVTIACAKEDYGPDFLFAVEYYPPGNPPPSFIKIYVTTDGGNTWREDALSTEAFGGRRLTRLEAAYCFGPDLHLIASFDDGSFGLIKRTGGTGPGRYNLIYLSYANPYCQNITAVAFKDAGDSGYGISTDGIAVGRETTVIIDEGQVYQEEVPFAVDLFAIAPASSNAFLAVGYNYSFYTYDLLYHP